MKMQILTKRKVVECSDIIRSNVDNDHWHWWSARGTTLIPIAGKVGVSQFKLRVKRTYPSFFTPVLTGDIQEEEASTRIVIRSSLTILPKIMFGLFLAILATLLLFDLPLPPNVRKNSLIILSLGGTALFGIGKQSVKPQERYLMKFMEELFADDHVIVY